MAADIHSTIKDQQLLVQKRALLCTAAARLFRRQGFDRTTIPEIASAAGMSVGSIYRYVNKKEDIMYLMLQQVSEQLNQEVYSLVHVDLPPLEKLFALMSRYYRFIDDNKDQMHVALRDMRFIEGFRTALQQQEARTVESFKSVLSEGVAAGVFAANHIDLLTYDLVFLGHMWVIRAYQFTGQPIESYIAKQFDIISRSLLQHDRNL